MNPHDFVGFLCDRNSKVWWYICFFETLYTGVVVIITIAIIQYSFATLRGQIPTGCERWKLVDFPAGVDGDASFQANVCTKLSSSGEVFGGMKFLAWSIFSIYLATQYIELTIFRSFRPTFAEHQKRGIIAYRILFWGNLIQTVCIITFGVLLIFYAETPLDAIIDSTAAIFLSETDDALIALVMQGKERKANLDGEVEVIVMGVSVTCPPNYLAPATGLMRQLKEQIDSRLPERVKEKGDSLAKASTMLLRALDDDSATATKSPLAEQLIVPVVSSSRFNTDPSAAGSAASPTDDSSLSSSSSIEV